MNFFQRFIFWLREPWLTTERAKQELRLRWPNHESRIITGNGFVKVYRNKTLMTNRPTLKQAMDRVRKYSPIPQG